jgi:hypothetical protein
MTGEVSQAWPCPACKYGKLQLDKDSFKASETRASIDFRNSKEDGYWEPDMTTLRFRCLLVCNQARCKEPVVACGTSTEEQEDDGEGGTQWKTYFVPVFFHPPPPIILIPSRCPGPITKELELAFALFWCDLRSCANRVRTAVELLLTHVGVARFQVDSNRHRRVRLNLHQRIQNFEAEEPELATRMFAVKWVGNEGSHPGKLSKDDLLDAFEIVEDMLNDMFVPPQKSRILEMAKAIHRAKKPRSHHRQSTRKR